MKIDFVSDVSCPWCAIGLKSLEEGIARLGDSVKVDLHFQPFELNPDMAPQGQDIGEHLMQKYGATAEQRAQSGEAIRARGAALGFTFRMDLRGRIYNTFDAHRLLHWAELEGRQLALKHALLKAYFTDGQDPSSHELLVKVAGDVGLDATRAREVLATNEFADEVREREAFYREHGIQAVPSVIINDRHLIQGGQPPEVFERALRELAAAGAE
ncbi:MULTISPECIES: DsbA family oxidoreductase [unclassified Rhizobacter]|uniref:DsbA family oxidoreductase n=1 Tax=unclassified Rhizobacter TaxID=2640088 RepID=UPI0006F477CE|nr:MULTISPECIES: DsbA family oxidoreductase [unclassified Rhizobacter]KQU78294.1 disulfide bond formation protein DsbA [Rhizobacter sp. Root29]KQW16040.1 disulfide bond formation protein DsbA [Rhizobacter sp. Root1238]KRB25158.1 disulfide bond formation protein DsbA [Rhizobacter sp. Root16D2]